MNILVVLEARRVKIAVINDNNIAVKNQFASIRKREQIQVHHSTSSFIEFPSYELIKDT